MEDGLSGIKDWLLAIGGNLAIIIFFFRAIGAWLDRQTSSMIGNTVMFVIVIAFVYFNSQMLDFVKEIAKRVFGWA